MGEGRDPLWNEFDRVGPTETRRRLGPGAGDAWNANYGSSAARYLDQLDQAAEARREARHHDQQRLQRDALDLASRQLKTNRQIAWATWATVLMTGMGAVAAWLSVTDGR